MLWIHCWDEISCEWEQVDLDISRDSSPQEIVRALDEAIAEPLGFIPSEEVWHFKSASQAGPLLTIECRTERNHLGIILVNCEENGIRRPTPSKECAGAAHTHGAS